MRKSHLIVLVYALLVSFVPVKGTDKDTKIAEKTFKNSKKFLVHIGFPDGLPKNGIMHSSKYDPALYFSINGPFPSTKLMSRLDVCPYVFVLPLAKVKDHLLSLHPTETLLAGTLDMCSKDYYIIAPKDAKLPEKYSTHPNVTRYAGKTVKARNACALQLIKKLGGYGTSIQLDEQESWDNKTKVTTQINGVELNVNNKDFYPILQKNTNVPYTCPASSQKYDVDKKEWHHESIGLLSELKSQLYSSQPGNVQQTQTNLEAWLDTLKHLDENTTTAFKNDIQNMINRQNSSGSLSRAGCCNLW